MSFRAGDAIGPYTLISPVGKGGMGQVWRAARPASFEVALKLIRADELESSAASRFLDEARIGLLLKHPNIVTNYDVGVDGEMLFIAMRLIAGPSLSALAKRCVERNRKFAPEVIAYVGMSIARALHFANSELALVHRDVSPQNILLEKNGAVFLTDFGVARSKSQLHTTARGIARGKPAYMSPEQVRDQELDVRSDLFALGIVLHELVTTKRLFKRDTILDSMNAVLKARASRVHSGAPKLDAIIAQLLSKDRGSRPKDAHEAARLLEPLAMNGTAMLAALIRDEELKPPRRSSRRLRATFTPRFSLPLVMLKSRFTIGALAGMLGIASSAYVLHQYRRHPVIYIEPHHTAPRTATLRYGSQASKDWFSRVRNRCTEQHVDEAVAERLKDDAWDERGYAAACLSLAGKIEASRAAIGALEPEDRRFAAAILFNVAHPIADAGDEAFAEPLMSLAAEFWPENYQALFHAGMADYAAQRFPRAREKLTRFLELADGANHASSRSAARDALQKMNTP